MLLFLKSVARKLVVLPVCIVFAVLLQAQQPTLYHFAHLDFNQGLSNNQINCIYKGKKGFMWFGTMSGLNRFDGYTFKAFRHSIQDTTSLIDDFISKIIAGPYNNLWIETRIGFNIYDPATEKFDRAVDKYLQRHGLPGYGLTDIVPFDKGYLFVYRDLGIYYFEENKGVIPIINNTTREVNVIADVRTDSKNNIWVVYCNGLIEQYDGGTKKAISQSKLLQQKQGAGKFNYRLFIDSQDEQWIFGSGIVNGIYRFNPVGNTIQQVASNEGTAVLSSNIILDVAEDNKGLLWIATDHGGLNILNKRNLSVQVLLNEPGNSGSLSMNSLTDLYKDDLGIIWIGTFKQGINYYHESIIQFPLYRHDATAGASLPYNDVNRFVEDAKGNLWIGTNGGGLIYFDRTNNTFKQYRHSSANDNSLSNDVIVSLLIDHANVLWIGTFFGGLDSYDGKTFTHHRHSEKDSSSLSDNRIWEIYEDRNNDLWIGTLESGLEKYDRANNRFIHYKPMAPGSVHMGYVSDITEDSQGNLWVGTSYGIDVLNRKTGVFTQMLGRETKLSNDNIISIFKDSHGNMWVGTRDGLNLYDPQNNSFRVFRKEDGLPDNTILNIVEDNARDLWVSTPNGISRISCIGDRSGLGISCINYDRADGLQGKEFNENAALKTRNGELVFGGPNGFNLFNPANLKYSTPAPKVVFTGLQVFNQNIAPGDKISSQVILQKAIAETETITLRYDENIFSIEFAALGYINTQKNKYAYRLQGFNNNWLYTDGSERKATYTNLDPGKYTFYVKASNDQGVWNEQAVAVNIVVLAPFWQTPLAYLLYILAAVAILFFARRVVIQQTKMRFALEQERKEASRIRELDQMKTRFFTNVSHEFRTPLSLILTPLERMIRTDEEPARRSQYELIHRNARRLLNLVNQLLDFRRMEVHELKLHTTAGDIAQFIEETAGSFTDIAEKKQIRFSYSASVKNLYTHFDHDKLERIIFNLLSNAFKFTPENGTVSVELNTVGNGETASLAITIKDSGIGIPAGRHEKIFERFFQHDVPGTMVNQGSGIGLAITKEFVSLMGGAISVESEEFRGSAFTVVLPVKEVKPATVAPVANGVMAITAESVTEATAQAASGKKEHTVLLVEDTEDFLFYLKDNLREYFNIAEAVNGREGWQKTLSVHPDIIVSDISMPVMNGIELCEKIKQDPRTRHIPVVLLTALTSEEQQLQGLETGAADYMTKPFNFEILVSKIKNLLRQQQSFKQAFTKQLAVKTTDVQVDDPNEKFVQDALAIVEKNIGNSDFSVEELSRALLLSRAAVYKRLFVLTGKTPIEFIRTLRLQRAAQLLEKTNMTVAEVAYETGFNNPKYFSKYFKTEYGKLPSAYQAGIKKGVS